MMREGKRFARQAPVEGIWWPRSGIEGPVIEGTYGFSCWLWGGRVGLSLIAPKGQRRFCVEEPQDISTNPRP